MPAMFAGQLGRPMPAMFVGPLGRLMRSRHHAARLDHLTLFWRMDLCPRQAPFGHTGQSKRVKPSTHAMINIAGCAN